MALHHKQLGKVALGLLLTCATVSLAQTIDRPCQGWNTARKANLSTVVQREWVYGYLAGLSEAHRLNTGQDMAQQLPNTEAIVSHMNQFCESHPEASVVQGALDLFTQIKQRP
jgi:hypothetical protein